LVQTIQGILDSAVKANRERWHRPQTTFTYQALDTDSLPDGIGIMPQYFADVDNHYTMINTQEMDIDTFRTKILSIETFKE